MVKLQLKMATTFTPPPPKAQGAPTTAGRPTPTPTPSLPIGLLQLQLQGRLPVLLPPSYLEFHPQLSLQHLLQLLLLHLDLPLQVTNISSLSHMLVEYSLLIQSRIMVRPSLGVPKSHPHGYSHLWQPEMSC